MAKDKIVDHLYCRFRKQPFVFYYGESVLLLWETNCADFILDVEWGPKDAMRLYDKTTVIVINENQFLQKVEIPVPDNLSGEYNLRLVQRETGYQGNVYTVMFKGDAEYRIGIASDNQDGVGVFSKLLTEIKKNDIDFFFHAGDIVSIARKLSDWHHQWFDPMQNYLFSGYDIIPISYARGNHDFEFNYAYKYSLEKYLWYTIVKGNTRFIFLDSNIKDNSQTEWLESELQSNHPNAKFTVILFHMGPFIEYWEVNAWEKKLQKRWNTHEREEYVPLFEKYSVDLVISGHSHIYQRGKKNGITYVLTGGAGGSLETPDEKVEDYGFYEKTYFNHHYAILDMNENEIKMVAYSLTSEIIDTFKITK